VEHLTLDVTVRSATDIRLRQTKEGVVNQAIWISPSPPRGFSVDVTGGVGLPTHIPAGFDTTYRLDVVGGHPATTGPWEARLLLIGPDDAGSPIHYETTTSFTVADAP
jgi:hypothetical protein